MKQRASDIFIIIIGTFIFAIGINYFAIPNTLSEGGVIGLTIITYYLFGWSPGIVNLILNLLLVAIGYKFFTIKTTIYTMVAIVFMSLFLELTYGWGEELNDDSLLAAMFAGLFVGIGLGMIFRAGGTSGGATTLAKLCNKFLGWSIGKAMLVIDIAVISMSAFVIGKEKAMYTLIAVFVGAKVIDKIVEGANERTAVMIISKYQEEVLDELINRMGRGVTILEGRGGYTKDVRKILYIVINKREIVQLRRIIEQIDEDAYVTTSNVQEIFKRGYKEA
ncbi:YitT family protein [Alteribacillus sp. YIM 98480]|uniref:YitT family protein n=1 Tax=Alteribacillus sp. YIM 98480 TaxID=2606599 RepID=UPI00131C9EFC|nr:YitT family protein [Alteribacillus sp. YIM 98480]